MPPSSPRGDDPRSIGRPRWCPTWPTTASSGSSLAMYRAGAGARTAAGPLPPWDWPASPRTASIAPSSPLVQRERPEEHLDAAGPHADQQQLSERAHVGGVLHRFRPGRIRGRDGGLRGLRRRRGGQPGPPAGPSPERRGGRRRPSAPCWGSRCAPCSCLVPGARGRPGRGQGNGTRGLSVEDDYEAIRRHVGLPLSLRPQRP